jgi:hypothetical protein
LSGFNIDTSMIKHCRISMAEDNAAPNASNLGGWPPEAYLPESGSNGNGNWVKFPDGTMICTKLATITAVPVTTITTGIYRTTSQVALGDFAQAFIDVPYISALPMQQSNFSWCGGFNSVSTTSAGMSYIMIHTGSTPASYTGVISITAIGRWK